MRIWSLHPKYLDGKGLIACWRETLLAQKVLTGTTKGYTKHPQLVRFRVLGQDLAAKNNKDDDQQEGVSTAANQIAMAAIGIYLQQLAEEAQSRGYNFNRDLIVYPSQKQRTDHDSGISYYTTTFCADPLALTINVTRGQVEYEWHHLLAKLKKRSPEFLSTVVKPMITSDLPDLSTLFRLIPGDIEPWEIIAEPKKKNKKKRKSSNDDNDNKKVKRSRIKVETSVTETTTTTDTNRRVTRSQARQNVNVTTTVAN